MILTEVIGDDWKGFYVNGILHVEGHEITPYDVVCAINDHRIGLLDTTEEIEYELKYCDVDWLENIGHFPVVLSDCNLVQ